MSKFVFVAISYTNTSPCDLFVSAKFESSLKAQHFQTKDEIEATSETELKTIPEKAFHQYFPKLQVLLVYNIERTLI